MSTITWLIIAPVVTKPVPGNSKRLKDMHDELMTQMHISFGAGSDDTFLKTTELQGVVPSDSAKLVWPASCLDLVLKPVLVKCVVAIWSHAVVVIFAQNSLHYGFYTIPGQNGPARLLRGNGQAGYDGEWVDGKPHGLGSSHNLSGYYDGEWYEGQPHGYGTYHSHFRLSFRGQFHHGKASCGIVTTIDGTEYLFNC